MSKCEWPVEYSTCEEPNWSNDEETHAEAKALFETMATDLLWNWTGKRYGICEATVRPCRDWGTRREDTYTGRGPFTSLPGAGRPGWLPVMINGSWFNLRCGRCSGGCHCDWSKAIKLPGPVREILEIEIDGEILDPSRYFLAPGGTLVRTDLGFWPNEQNLDKPLGEVGTWGVTYKRGEPVPSGGRIAAGVLARELFLASCGDPDCGLPQRVQTVTRQGVTVAVLDAFEDVEQGRTGIWLIDSWVASVAKSPRKSTVLSPDVPRSVGRV